MDGTQRFLFATTASLLLVEEGSNRLRFKAVRPRENLAILKSFEDRLMVGTGIVGYVAETGESLCLYDAQKDTRFYSRPDSRTGFQTRSVLCTPIRLEDNVIGVIQVIDSQEGKFSQDDLRVLEAIAAFTASAIRNAEAAEGEMLTAMSVVTSDIAHKLKNDVGLILVTAQSLLKKLGAEKADSVEASLQTKLERIRDRAEQVIGLMEEIRHPFSDLSLEDADLGQLLDSALESVLAKTNEGKSVDVRRNYQELPLVKTYKTRVSAVFVKVLENAIEAMAGCDSKVLALEIWQPEPLHVRIGIADTGPGIPPEIRSQLFRPFPHKPDRESTHRARGWGYGLWSSRLFIRRMGGTIFLDEEYAGGTRMVIELPMRPPLRHSVEEPERNEDE
jgi:signal transduction histidine kinase